MPPRAILVLLALLPVVATSHTLLRTKVSTTSVPASPADAVLARSRSLAQSTVRDVLRDARSAPSPAHPPPHQRPTQTTPTFNSWSQLFQWAVAQTTATAENDTHGGPRLSVPDAAGAETPAEVAARRARNERLRASQDADGERELDVMARAVAVLKDASADAEDRLAALYALEELCHNIDNGMDLASMDGVREVSKFAVGTVAGDDTAAKSVALWTMATCTQNNPTVQEQFVEFGVVPKLVDMVDRRETTSEVRARCLFALASLLEGSEAGRSEFSAEPSRSAEVLLRALGETGSTRAVRRALYIAELMLRSAGTTEWLERLTETGFAEEATRLVRHTDPDVSEAAATFLATWRTRKQ